MTISTVIWDLGGVLFRTENYAPRERLAKGLGMNRRDLEHLMYSGESGTRAQRGEISFDEHRENIRIAIDLPPEEMDALVREFWGGDRLDLELVNYIRGLRSRFKTGLLSNAFSDLRQMITEVWQFADAFDEMIISAEVGMMKPDPRVYQIALERLDSAPNEVVFIDDFSNNVEGARALNITAIHFRDSIQALTELKHILEDGEK